MPDPQWPTFFKHEAPRYLQNPFTRNTHAEIDFIEKELHTRPGQSFLDIGCGTGRHCLELARRGYRCTGIDLSPDMLAIATSLAHSEHLNIDFLQGDASTTRLDRRFDHAICLCEGAFSLLETDTDPIPYHHAILDNIAAMLHPGAMFLLTALNGYRFARQHTDHDVAAGRFNPLTLTHVEELPTPGGPTVRVAEKAFMPAELRELLEHAGFHVLSLWGGTANHWNKTPLHLDEIELMTLAQKT